MTDEDVARAWLHWRGDTFLYEQPRAAFPETPLLGLIAGVHESLPDEALAALRTRLFTNQPLSDFCRALVKVCAKRASGDQAFEAVGDVRCVRWLPDGPADAAMASAQALVPWPALPPTLPPVANLRRLTDTTQAELLVDPVARHQRPRAVHALLVDAHDRVIWHARNDNGTNRVRHAEMLLTLGWWQTHGRPFPDGSRILVSLKPCRMCAAFLWRAQEGAGALPVPVEYLLDDPGPMARGTCYEQRPAVACGEPLLRKISDWEEAGSADQRR